MPADPAIMAVYCAPPLALTANNDEAACEAIKTGEPLAVAVMLEATETCCILVAAPDALKLKEAVAGNTTIATALADTLKAPVIEPLTT